MGSDFINSKLEYRNPKQIRNSNDQMTQTERKYEVPDQLIRDFGLFCFEFWSFVLVSCFVIRISNFFWAATDPKSEYAFGIAMSLYLWLRGLSGIHSPSRR